MSYKFTGGMSHIRNVVTEGLRYRLVDARGEVVGRLASRLSILLQGKDKPTYQPHKSEGDVVVVVNAAEVTLTGRKMDQKKYYRHTGYVGGLVERTAREMMNQEPTFVLRKAVERMLPKNKLRREMMQKLRCSPGEARVRGARARPVRDAPTRHTEEKNPDRGRAGWVPAHESRTTPTRRGARNQKQRGEEAYARAERSEAGREGGKRGGCARRVLIGETRN